MIRFELRPAGLLGAAVVCFCIFLWMFLLGIWAGQTVLTLPQLADGSAAASAESPSPQEGVTAQAAKRDAASQEAAEPEPSFFSVQVGAFSTEERAKRAVYSWRARGHKSFYQAPEGPSDSFWRVFVGKYDDLADAYALSDKFEKEENIRGYIGLVAASKIRNP